MAGDAEESGGKYTKENENSFRFLCVPIVTFYGYLVNGRERRDENFILFTSTAPAQAQQPLSRLDGIKKVDEGNNNNGMEESLNLYRRKNGRERRRKETI